MPNIYRFSLLWCEDHLLSLQTESFLGFVIFVCAAEMPDLLHTMVFEVKSEKIFSNI